MKILVSSKHLCESLKKVLKNNSFEWFQINSQVKILQFYYLGMYIDVDIDTIEPRNLTFKATIDRIKWYKLMKLLKELPEQPIVLEFEDEDNASIKISQFVYIL